MMAGRFRCFTPPILAAVFCCLAALGGLVENSPFIPPDWQPAGDQPIDRGPSSEHYSGLQFQGVYEIGGVWSCNILDARTGKSSWVRAGQSMGNAKLQHYNPEEDSVLLLVDGRELTLRLKDMPANFEMTRMASTVTPSSAHHNASPMRKQPASGDGIALNPDSDPSRRDLRNPNPPSQSSRGVNLKPRRPSGSVHAVSRTEFGGGNMNAAVEPRAAPSGNYNPRVFAGLAKNRP